MFFDLIAILLNNFIVFDGHRLQFNCIELLITIFDGDLDEGVFFEIKQGPDFLT